MLLKMDRKPLRLATTERAEASPMRQDRGSDELIETPPKHADASAHDVPVPDLPIRSENPSPVSREPTAMKAMGAMKSAGAMKGMKAMKKVAAMKAMKLAPKK